jgi:hypothetical protein
VSRSDILAHWNRSVLKNALSDDNKNLLITMAVEEMIAAQDSGSRSDTATNSAIRKLLCDIRGDYDLAASVGNKSASDIVNRIDAVLAQLPQ